jgi:hypothetical protein
MVLPLSLFRQLRWIGDDKCCPWIQHVLSCLKAEFVSSVADLKRREPEAIEQPNTQDGSFFWSPLVTFLSRCRQLISPLRMGVFGGWGYRFRMSRH